MENLQQAPAGARKALIIHNPLAGRRRAGEKARTLAGYFTRGGWQVETAATARQGDARDIARVQAAGHDLVVCCGGDGTLHELVCGLLDTGADMPVGYIPAGTTNDVARTLGLPTDADEAARTVAGGRARPLDAGRFNDDYFCYVASFGAFTDVAYRTPQRMKNMLGHLAYLLYASCGLPGLHPYEMEYEVDGEAPERGQFLFGSVSNAHTLSGMFRFKPGDVRLDDGEMELMLLRAPENPVAFFKMIHLLLRRRTDGRLVVFRHAREVRFRFARETPWTLDGEFAKPVTQADIAVLPRAVRFIQPPA